MSKKQNAKNYYNQGVIYQNENNNALAIKSFTMAIECDPHYTHAYLSRGDVYCREGKFDNAIKDYSNAIKLDPYNIDNYERRGTVYYWNNQYKESIKDFNKILSIYPDNADVLEKLQNFSFKEIHENIHPDKKSINLIDAYVNNKLPRSGGYIITSVYNKDHPDTRYEVIFYNDAKTILYRKDGLQFYSNGERLLISVVSNASTELEINYYKSHYDEYIPKKYWNIPKVISTSNQRNIIVPKFSDKIDCSFLIYYQNDNITSTFFYQLPDVYKTIKKYFEDLLIKQDNIPQNETKKAAGIIAKKIETAMSFNASIELSIQ